MPASDTRDDPKLQQAIKDFGLEGRRLYLAQMPYGGSALLAAAIRSIGLDAWATSDSNERTLELGARYTSGDECYPQKITLGDYLRVVEEEGQENVGFLMPTANGPCRFGQYLHLIRTKFDELGYTDVPLISISSSDGYSSIGSYSMDLVRTAWRAVVAQDILMKLLLKTRPYELEEGSTDALYLRSIDEVAEVIAQTAVTHKERLAGMVVALTKARDGFRALPARYDLSRPLVIDPLLASTYLGTSEGDGVSQIPSALGPDGCVYVASRTQSAEFPVTPGAYDTTFDARASDLFVAKLDPDLTTLLAATFLDDEAVWGVMPPPPVFHALAGVFWVILLRKTAGFRVYAHILMKPHSLLDGAGRSA